MTGRDRIVLMAIVVLVVLAGGWLMVVSPERKQAAEAQTAVQTAQGQLQSAEAAGRERARRAAQLRRRVQLRGEPRQGGAAGR